MKKRTFKAICLAMCCSMVVAAAGCEIKKQPENIESKEIETKTVTESEQATDSSQGTEATQETDASQTLEATQETDTSQTTESAQAAESEQETVSAQETESGQTTESALGTDVETKEVSSPDETTILDQNDFEEPFGEEISIDAATRKKMNIFISNFTEAGMYAYDKDHYDINTLYPWVHIWMKINKGSELEYVTRPGEEYDSTYEVINLEKFNQITKKYLGITISEEEVASTKLDWGPSFYEDGIFYAPAADGESYTEMSVVSKVEKLEDGRLKLYYNNYDQTYEAYEQKDKDYSMTEEEASKNPDYEKGNSGYAIVRTEGSSYILEHLEERN